MYAGAAHGWCPPDSRVYNEPQAEKAWGRLLVLYWNSSGLSSRHKTAAARTALDLSDYN